MHDFFLMDADLLSGVSQLIQEDLVCQNVANALIWVRCWYLILSSWDIILHARLSHNLCRFVNIDALMPYI